MRTLKERAFSYKKRMIFLLLSAVLIGLSIVGQAYFLVKIVDGVFLQGKSFEEVLVDLLWLLLCLCARSLFIYLSRRSGLKLATKVKSEYRGEFLKKYASLSFLASKQGQSGRKISVVTDAIDEIDGYFSQYIPQLMQTAFVPILILVVVASQHLNSGLIMLVTAPFIPLFMIIVGLQTRDKSEEQVEKLASFSGRFLDSLQGLTTLKLFGRANQQKQTILKSSLGFRDATMAILKVAFTQTFMLEIISMLSIGIIALELVIQIIIYDQLTFFTGFFVMILVPEFYSSLKELGSAFHNGRSSIGAAKKVDEELAREEETVTWGDAPLVKKMTPPKLELRQLSYSYGEEKFQLESINTEVSPYSKIAIVGPSGSGKTTLLQLIAGLIRPTNGQVMVDGKPLSEYEEKSWFNQLSYISQNPYLFSGTIAENIAIEGGRSFTQDELGRAIERAGLSGMIRNLKDGAHTLIGEGGRGLSGGEKQRVALARAFLKEPSVILFDEPTNGLDLETERLLQRSIQQLSKQATIITVAHRLYTIKDADQILFMKEGQLKAVGSHDDLYDRVAEYREMVTVQRGESAS
ncbi:thiol reductant ABC exporter subunit CydD [Alkalicoccobacillus murimartini]|uniref:ATP-binding cassette subfamily C protein CydD n=1 Tax=Alkalicoccobacillus murimartini TaxID=171685 RepID=A0ABT9YI90_9BACI|nr:thiol reductant ABC exporter subunit CydD [Alkalicoccobacillus murimartini]MDQ0207575.1 ATP-binding cassette subfamily C protein CydD [Alkalicoccobacillus murimartini]